MPWSCGPARPEMTKSPLPSTPQQLLEKMGSLQSCLASILGLLTLCRRLRRHARLTGGTAHIKVCHSADDSWVPSKGFALFPRHQSEAVRTFAIWTWQVCLQRPTYVQSDHSARGVWLFSLELSCKQNYGPQWNWPNYYYCYCYYYYYCLSIVHQLKLKLDKLNSNCRQHSV